MNSIFGSAMALRRRSVWEAIDSGVLLWRNNFVYFIPFFAIPVWIAACGLRLLPADYRPLSYLVLWWLKPLFDRLILHVVSQRFFGSAITGGYRELRQGLWTNLARGLLGDLLWRRFSPGRAARLPVRVLERLGGKQFKQRKNTLAAGGLNFCSFISFLGLMTEAMLLAGEIIFILIMTQMFFPSALTYMRDNLETVEHFIFIAFCINYILAESFYICMGFGLYVNSRVEVEGWDLQILFQKFAAPASVPVSKVIPIACFFLALLLGPASTALYAGQDESSPPVMEEVLVQPEETGESADEDESGEPIEYFPEGFPYADDEALEKLDEILSSEDFGSEREGWGVRFKQSEKFSDIPDIKLAPWMEKIRQLFSFLLRFLVILAIAAFVGFALYWFLKTYGKLFRRKGRFGSRRKRMGYAGPLLPSESPEVLFNRAEDLFKQGKFREAWAACLSACMGAYVRYHSLSFPGDATEYGCLDMVRRVLPDEDKGFGDLVQNWILFAYGGRPPLEGAFEKVLAYGRSIREPGSGASDEP